MRPSSEVARLDLDSFGRLPRNNPRSQLQVRNVDLARRLAQWPRRWVARIGPHAVLHHVGATDPIDVCEIGTVADAREHRRQVIKTMSDNVDHVPFTLAL